MEGLRIRTRRKKLGISGKDIADALNTTKVTVSRWETGKSEPDDKTKFELAKLLKTSVAYLMGETDNPDPDFSTALGNIVYEEDRKKQEIKQKNDILEDESYAYWGGMLDKARRAATRGNEKEISLIKMFLKSAYEMFGSEEKKEKEGHQ